MNVGRGSKTLEREDAVAGCGWKRTSVRESQKRSREAEAAEAKTVCTACPFGYTMLSDGVKELEWSEKLQVIDVARLVVKAADLDG